MSTVCLLRTQLAAGVSAATACAFNKGNNTNSALQILSELFNAQVAEWCSG